MSASYDHINDEEELHKLMNAADNFEDRKKIRSRLKEIREKQREEMEAKRLVREKETEDLVRRRFQIAEEEKQRKLQAYKHQAPTHQRDTEYHQASDKAITDKHRQAEEDKQKKLEAYKNIAKHEHDADGGRTQVRTTTSTTKAPDGSTTITKKTETTSVKQTSGFGGVQYGTPTPYKGGPELNTRQMKEQLSSISGPGSSGSISVKTESWSSQDGTVHKAQKTESWGAKPQGARGAMAAFKQMDATNPGPKVNKPTMARSPSSIKQILLDWAKSMTQEYKNIEVTNFSTSWNNGLAFCALIHHFYPDAFDYSQLDAKNRRYNFNLAFDTAEKVADIAPLLDVEDMVKMKNPDWKCVFTYVQSFYRHLRDHENNKAKAPAEAES